MSPAVLVDAFGLIIPEAVLGLAACILFLGGTFRAGRHLWGASALAALAVAGLTLLFVHSPDESPSSLAGPLVLDRLGWLVKAVALGGGGVLVLLSWNEVPDRQAADYHACLLIIVAGLSLTGSANELVTLFLALELISIPTYVLLYLPRYDDAAQEAALKYFLLSVFSSALLLFGFSYLYGLAGTTNMPAITDALGTAPRADSSGLPAVGLVALVMVIAGLSFRIAAVPFHFYAPDVYQGTPTPAAALLAFIPKVAGFVALFRVLGLVSPGSAGTAPAVAGHLAILLWILAAVTMFLGNVLALLQQNLKRLLAYSSVAHAGYMLIGLAVAPYLPQIGGGGEGGWLFSGGVAAVLFYLVAYSAMTIGAFAVLAYLSTPERPVEMEDDLAGLSQSHSGVAALMAVFLFSLIGIPLTGGFIGKLLVFYAAVQVGGERALLFLWLAIIGVINAAIGAWYYVRILTKMYLHTPIKPLEPRRAWPGLASLWICAAVTLALGIPTPLLQKVLTTGMTSTSTSQKTGSSTQQAEGGSAIDSRLPSAFCLLPSD